MSKPLNKIRSKGSWGLTVILIVCLICYVVFIAMVYSMPMEDLKRFALIKFIFAH